MPHLVDEDEQHEDCGIPPPPSQRIGPHADDHRQSGLQDGSHLEKFQTDQKRLEEFQHHRTGDGQGGDDAGAFRLRRLGGNRGGNRSRLTGSGDVPVGIFSSDRSGPPLLGNVRHPTELLQVGLFSLVSADTT